MKSLALSQLSEWCGGRLEGDDLIIQGIGTDTRSLTQGSLYIALRGENFDGHDFVAVAEANGAVALLVERAVESSLSQIICTNAQLALGQIAAALASDRDTRVLAITGSNGKTTTRTLTYSILKCMGAEIWSNQGNRNNEIGLPLAVIDQPETARFAVYEMGAGALGDIAYLTQIVRPDVALVNNIAPAHLERMGSLLGIADTKAAIYDALTEDGVAVINADDAFAPYFASRAGSYRVLSFGLENTSDVWADEIQATENGLDFVLKTPWGDVAIQLPLHGRHQVSNALAAATMAMAVGATLTHVAEGLAKVEGVPGRMQSLTLASGVQLVDDSYNANPGSVVAAISTLAAQAKQRGGKSWLVLGDMRELGPNSASLHADVGLRAKYDGINYVLTVGEMSRHAALAFGATGEAFDDQASLVANLQARVEMLDVVLVKGSRGSRMDKVVAALVNGATAGDHHAA